MHFCDDEESSVHKHNREAPNKHNAVCDMQSVWSVISRHADFAGNNNMPTNIANLKPTFNVVRVLNGSRYVLVTDVSGSMTSSVGIVDMQFYLLYYFLRALQCDL
jgi:calcium-activated chloride channel regulator 4